MLALKAQSGQGRQTEELSLQQSDTRADLTSDYGAPKYHRLNPSEEEQRQERLFRKRLNAEARQSAAGTIHERVAMIVHRPDYTEEDMAEYDRLLAEVMPAVREIARKTLPLLENDRPEGLLGHKYYGSRFEASAAVYGDLRTFSRRPPPSDRPSLAVALRIDESASMAAFGRIKAARQSAIAIDAFCRMCKVPLYIYGDTADASPREQMSLFAYSDGARPRPDDKYRLTGIRPRSNNRDGMAMRALCDRLAREEAKTRLLITISDGQPKAMPDYTGKTAGRDLGDFIAECTRRNVTLLAAAIGQDKDVIRSIYGEERFLDIGDLNALPARLVGIIARHI